MSHESETPYRVYVVLDPAYGERLRELPRDEAAWVVDSEINHPVIAALWHEHKGQNHIEGITSFRNDAERKPADQFISILSTIDLHHGEYSHTPPYSVLEVIGTPWSSEIEEALEQFGFPEHEDTAEGFVARRSPPDRPE